MAYTPDQAFDFLHASYKRGRLAHAFLISGKKKSGKSTLAARLVNLLNTPQNSALEKTSNPRNPHELESMEGEWLRIVRPSSASRQILISSIRGLEKFFYTSSHSSQWKVGVIVNAQCMNIQASNAFLKTLEEPPPNTLLLLLTQNPEALLPTILSRCVHLELFSPPPGEESPLFAQLLPTIHQQLKNGFSQKAALSIKAQVALVLEEEKQRIDKDFDKRLKEEIKHYAKTTESSAWLKEREATYKALSSSHYIAQRSELIELFVAWFGELIAHSIHASLPPSFPSLSPINAILAPSEQQNALIRRWESLITLRDTLETNVLDSLAMEVGFLQAFGKPS